ncbi:MAG: hypothetical protein ABTQ29_04190, partial [Siculibacillus sp.]
IAAGGPLAAAAAQAAQAGGGESGGDGARDLHPTHVRIEEAKAIGAVQAGSVKKIGEMIVETPNEAAMIIRGWLNEAA